MSGVAVRIGYMRSLAPYMSAAVAGFAMLAAAVACGTADDAAPATAEPIVTVRVDVTVADAADAVADDVAAGESAVPSVPHRGYNVLGDPDAPIVLYDYSDFV